MTFEEFFNLLNGTSIDYDNYYGSQCVDLIQFWSRAIGGQRFTGDAQDVFDQAGNFYFQVPNTPDGVPQKGDIVVWSSKFNGTVGHVGIATGKGDTNSFECFEQNDPSPGVCHLKTYNYQCVLGWLHPKVLPPDLQIELDQCRIDRDNHWNDFQTDEQKIKDLTTDITTKNGLLTTLQQQFDDYKLSHPDQPQTPPIPPVSTPVVPPTTVPDAPPSSTLPPTPTVDLIQVIIDFIKKLLK